MMLTARFLSFNRCQKVCLYCNFYSVCGSHMANSEVESITNGLDRCTNLLKDLLNEPYKQDAKQIQSKAKKPIKVPEKLNPKATKVVAKKCWNYGAKKPPAKGMRLATTKPAAKNTKKPPGKTTSFNENLPSSTPIVTPVKKEKLQRKTDAVSITSSQCSLIELLQEYNLSQTPVKEVSKTPLSSTFKAPDKEEPSPKPVITVTLPKTRSFTERPPSVSNKSDSTSLPKESYSSQAEQSQLQLLQNENIVLHKQLRTMKERFFKKEQSRQNEDISLEVATLQCQNAALERKLAEMVSATDQTNKLQKEVRELNLKLKEENQSLHHELHRKEEELAMTGKLFSTETEQIKHDVKEALGKVELLRKSLREAEDANESLSEACKAKDVDIERLTDLNRGLQSTVSRLLEDLKRPPPAPPIPQADANVSAAMLKRLDDILSVPMAKPTPKRYVPPSPSELAFALPRTPIAQDPQALEVRCISPIPPSVVTSLAESSIVTTRSPVSSSMMSTNTQYNDHEFDVGLAALDADIKRLQESLRVDA